jgi:GntR family transcriptional regulator/MocR family aminotransferase
MASAAAPAGFFNSITIDRKSRVPFYQQLYEAIRQQIETGMLPANHKIPSIDDIASRLQVPRNTVRRALEKLEAEQYVETWGANGHRVCRRVEKAAEKTVPQVTEWIPPAPEPYTPVAVVEMTAAPAPASIAEPPAAIVAHEPQTAQASEIRTYSFNRISVLEQIDLAKLHASGPPRPFRPGFPSTQEFPIEVWEALRVKLLRQRMAEMLDHSGTFGHLPLRQAVAARLRNARGVKCSAEQVIICAGAQQALNLVINTLVSPGDAVGLEEPGHYGVKAAFLQAGARVQPLLVDEEGVSVPDARRQNPPQLIFTTPSHQFPLGSALTLPRRLALLNFARKTGTWIIEDDSDGDFSYMGRPLPSLQGADDQNRVIYLGTTGKTLFPSLEIGYVVVPLSLMESFSKTKEIMGGQPCVIDQAVLATFIGEGHFDRHLQRMNIIYHQRLQALSDSVGTELRGFIDLEPSNGGLHAVGWLARGLDEDVVANGAARAGIELPLLSSFGKTALTRPGVVFGFASFSERMIRQTVERFGQALRSPQKFPALPSAPTLAPPRPSFFQRLLPARFQRG